MSAAQKMSAAPTEASLFWRENRIIEKSYRILDECHNCMLRNSRDPKARYAQGSWVPISNAYARPYVICGLFP